MRRSSSPFSLSLLDLLTAALGAVIFLFVITPKGGAGAAAVQQAGIFFDTATMRIHGTLPDSLLAKRPGDTLFAMLVDYRVSPRAAKPVTPASEVRVVYRDRPAPPAPAGSNRPDRRVERKATSPRLPTPDPAKPPQPPAPTKPDPAYRGTPPSVPARLSFELSWPDRADNVDLFVCQGSNCVYGERKRDRAIGNWDSGKSRNRLFGNDLRTNQEAVRQFDELLPGTYTLYARFKESERGRSSVEASGLIYTKDDAGKPRGQTYARTLQLSERRTRLITVVVAADGTFATR